MSQVYTELVYGVNGDLVHFIGFDYGGPVEMCKGQGTAKSQMEKQNALQQQAFDMQKAQLDFLKQNLSQYLTGSGQGYDPAQLALLKSQFANQTASDFNSAGNNVRAALAARGGMSGATPPGGDVVRGLVGLEGARASTLTGGMRDIDLSNLQAALSNRFNAANVLSGNAATLSSPIATFGSGANNALAQYISASNQGSFANAFKSGFGSTLGGILGGGKSSQSGGWLGMG